MIFERVAELGLYVHFPFCKNRCGYCHFYTENPRSPEQVREAVDAIIAESSRYADNWSSRGILPRVKTFYLGGGTPSILPKEELLRLVRTLGEHWNWADLPPAETAMEVNPENFTAEFLQTAEEAGFSRLSIGVQSFQQETLDVLNRCAGRLELLRSLDVWTSHVWKIKPKLNLDLILGTPRQTLANLEKDLVALLPWDPDHVSLYGLSIDVGTPLDGKIRSGEVAPLTIEFQEDLWEEADRWLELHGWRNYEISNYARPGSESLHNIGYWKMRPWIGLGPGAVGTIPVSDPGGPRVLRRKNPIFSQYHPWDPSFWETGELEWVGRSELFLDFLITGLRLATGLSFSILDSVFQVSSREVLAPWIDGLDRKGVLCFSDSNLRLNRRGRFGLDRYLLSAIDLVREHPLLKTGPAPRWS